MFYTCDLFLYYPLDLRTSEWTARGYVTDSWGYGVLLISRDWIFHIVPVFGEMEKLPQISPNI